MSKTIKFRKFTFKAEKHKDLEDCYEDSIVRPLCFTIEGFDFLSQTIPSDNILSILLLMVVVSIFIPIALMLDSICLIFKLLWSIQIVNKKKIKKEKDKYFT